MKKQSVCLNMIVKDESHIILKTLENVLSKIKISYWVICDTGSTDGTQDLIKKFFADRGIPGELHEDTWKDFGHNRTLAVQKAYKKGDYLLFFDADDEIIGDFQMPEKLDKESYSFTFGPVPKYSRSLLVKGDVKWKWSGVLHEYVSREDDIAPTSDTIIGDYYVFSGKTGNRSKTPDLYLRDAEILENAYNQELGNNGILAGRYAYYCAQSYKDFLDYANAEKWYRNCAKVSTWDQEAYHAMYMAGWCMMRVDGEKSTEDIAAQMFTAWMRRPTRIESLFDLGMLYKDLKMWQQAYAVLKICAMAELPDDTLFVNTMYYEGISMDEFAIVSWWAGKYQESALACNRIIDSIQKNEYPGEHLPRIQTNLWYAERSMGKYSTDALNEFIAEKSIEVKEQFQTSKQLTLEI